MVIWFVCTGQFLELENGRRDCGEHETEKAGGGLDSLRVSVTGPVWAEAGRTIRCE
jgi:hypothetical protein